jgi:hypothetical protein
MVDTKLVSKKAGNRGSQCNEPSSRHLQRSSRGNGLVAKGKALSFPTCTVSTGKTRNVQRMGPLKRAVSKWALYLTQRPAPGQRVMHTLEPHPLAVGKSECCVNRESRLAAKWRANEASFACLTLADWRRPGALGRIAKRSKPGDRNYRQGPTVPKWVLSRLQLP